MGRTLLHILLMHLRKSVCVCAYMVKLKKHINTYIDGIFAYTQKTIILQTSKNVPCMIKAKIIEGFPATAVKTEVPGLIHDLKIGENKRHTQQSLYDPLALSHQAAAVAVTSLITRASGTRS